MSFMIFKNKSPHEWSSYVSQMCEIQKQISTLLYSRKTWSRQAQISNFKKEKKDKSRVAISGSVKFPTRNYAYILYDSRTSMF